MPVHSALKALLLGTAVLMLGGAAQAQETSPAHPLRRIPQAEAPFQIAENKPKVGQLDVFDEPPVGELGVVRGKRNDFADRNYGPRPNRWYDVGILFTSSGLVGLMIFVFSSRRRTPRT